jgi:hypothetical protein
MTKGFLAVEGHGDIQAALNLIMRLQHDLHLDVTFWQSARGQALNTKPGIDKS